MANDRRSPSTSRALWWLLLVLAIGAAAGLVGASAGLPSTWVALAAGGLAAVLPPVLDERLRRRELTGRGER